MTEIAHSKAFVARRVVPFLTAMLVIASSSYACSNQSEGERCDAHNGNEDCGDGLVCTAKGTLGTDSDRCCPQNRSTATADVCKQSATPSGGDASIPVEDSSTSTDSAADSATNDGAASSDAASEAAADANDDATTDAGADGQ